MMVALLRDSEPIGDPLLCRSIMGANFLGREDIVEHIEQFLSLGELERAGGIKFPLRFLQGRKDSHILFLGYPLIVSQVVKISRMHWSCDHSWLSKERFANEKKVRLGWYLLSRKTVSFSLSSPDVSLNKIKFDKGGGRCPLACELVYASALYSMKTGQTLFERETKVFTADRDRKGNPVFVQNSSLGLTIGPEDPSLLKKVSIAPLLPATRKPKWPCLES